MEEMRQGDEVISTNDLYGGSYRLFTKIFEGFGIKFHFVGMDNVHDYNAGLRLAGNQQSFSRCRFGD